MLTGFDTAAVLLLVAAVAGYLNHRFLRLPTTSGTLAVALASSALVVVADGLFPGLQLRPTVARFLADIDFNAMLMRGMLCFLLFAGALHVDLGGLLANKWTIGLLASVGVAISTAVTGLLTWWIFNLAGQEIPLLVCLLFGAVIAPTDPIAVIGLLRELGAPKALEAQIAGESLFNDGVGVVVFFALLSLAGLHGAAVPAHLTPDPAGLMRFFVLEVAGGAAIGLAAGYLGYRALKTVDDRPLELLMTLALVMCLYTLAFQLHTSGPIAVVVAGIVIGNPGRRLAMTETTRAHVDAFWSMLDEIFNAVLFLLIGLQVFAVSTGVGVVLTALLAIPIALTARLISVIVPVTAMRIRRKPMAGLVAILTWSGLRGGISVAMILSLPPTRWHELLLTATYAVVVFSILVQGLTMRRVLRFYRVGRT